MTLIEACCLIRRSFVVLLKKYGSKKLMSSQIELVPFVLGHGGKVFSAQSGLTTSRIKHTKVLVKVPILIETRISILHWRNIGGRS